MVEAAHVDVNYDSVCIDAVVVVVVLAHVQFSFGPKWGRCVQRSVRPTDVSNEREEKQIVSSKFVSSFVFRKGK